jgi:hypothetical protein
MDGRACERNYLNLFNRGRDGWFRREQHKRGVQCYKFCVLNITFLNTKPEGSRGVGRPKFRWLDDVGADIKSRGIKRWRLKAQDRKERKIIPREAAAKLKGQQSQGKKKRKLHLPMCVYTPTIIWKLVHELASRKRTYLVTGSNPSRVRTVLLLANVNILDC